MASDKTDVELLRLMADASPESSSKQAWEDFYYRHKKYLYAVLLRAHGRDLGEARIADLVQETLLRAYQKASTYRSDGSTDAGCETPRVRAWLGRIAENLLRDSLRRAPTVVFIEEAELEAENIQVSDIGLSDTRDLNRLEDAFNKLSPREQEVLRVTTFWYRSGQRQQRLPNHVMTKLTTELGTTADNIRQIRARAIKSLRKLMENT